LNALLIFNKELMMEIDTNNVNDPVNTPAQSVQSEASADAATPVATEAKKTVEKNVAAKKAVVNKTVAKKAVAKKAVAKKAVAKKVVAKKATTKTAVAKNATVNKPVAEKVTAKKPRVANALKAVPADAQSAPKAKKVKLVRDSFTMPGNEYQVLLDIKKAALKAGIELKKSELLRIGIGMLKSLTVAQLDQSRAALTKLSAGRPKK